MQLKKENCECSKDPARTTIEVFAWLNAAVVGLFVLLKVYELVAGDTSKKM
jgi:hypothetical protein